ncbi:hypothetical protein NCR_03323 [Burkholderia pseudomallei]
MGRRNRAGGGGRGARCRRPVRAARQRECGARPLRRRNARATLDVAGEGVRAAAHPRSNVQTLMRSAFGCSGVRVFGCSGVRVFGCSGVRVFGCSGVRVFGCSGVRVFGCSGVRVFGCSGVRVFEQGGRRRRAALGPASLGQRTFNPRASDCRSARRLPALRPTTARVSRPRANRRNAARPVPAPPRRATHHPSARFARRARSRGVLPQLFAHVSCSPIL